MTAPRRNAARPRVHLVSLGCAKNQVDSESLLGGLVEAGALICERPEDADVIVVNTCGFITDAKQESIDAILEAARFKEEGVCRRLVAVGCLAERYGRELRDQMPEIDAFAGVGDVDAMVRACGLEPRGCGRLRLGPRHIAYLRIADGCDNRCAYCAIPIIRGPLRSAAATDIVAEADALVRDGAREIVIIAQDTTAYGADLAGAPALPALVERIAEKTGDAWLRLMYTHPAHFTDDLVEAYARVPSLLPYVDLPLQHLSDPILARMGRRMTQALALRLIERLREKIAGVAVRTTLLVGFPGETDRDFEEMLRLVEQIRFDNLGAFEFSAEEGTSAERMPDQVPEGLRRERFDALMALQQRIASENGLEHVGADVDVMVDGPDPLDADRSVGRTCAQAPDVDGVTFLPRRLCEPGRVVRSRIVGADVYDLFAEEAQRP